jgi:hypothetical protein
VIVQGTRFSEWLKANCTEAVERVNRDHEIDCRVARRIAAEFFDSGVVLQDLLRRATATTRSHAE